MALYLTELIDEVKAAIGRDDDTTLITDTRVLRWLNKAQEEIAEQCPGLTALDFKNTTSVDFTEVLQYALVDFTSSLTTPVQGSDTTDRHRICHLYNAYYLDGDESIRLKYLPLDDFDRSYPDPTHADYTPDKPEYYTRRGNYLEVYPLCATANADTDFRLDGSLYPPDFTATDSTAYSALENADDLLIAYAVFKAWTYVGKSDNAQLWLTKFYSLLEDYKRRNDVLHEWEANLYGPYV